MNRPREYHRSAQKSLSPQKTNKQPPTSNNLFTNNMYFCHYRNAIYMGPSKNFKK